ncbi:MAG: hypothetical protein PHF29_06835 [Candidatus Riflebacteria bacterium]|nr:hypothetical protein [Candidatus Riflebacteria bacterium]
MIKNLFGVLCVLLLLPGCGSEPAKKNTVVDKSVQTEAEVLKNKAKAASSASKMIGYDGDRINKDLNTIINKSEEMKSQFEDVGLD